MDLDTLLNKTKTNRGFEEARELLKREPLPVDQVNGYLLFGSEYGYYGLVQILLEFGANPNSRLAFKNACEQGWIQIVQLLLEWGAEPDLEDGLNLIKASQKGHLNVVKLLLEWGANPNLQEGKSLVKAIKGGYDQIAQLLLEWGAEPNNRDGLALIEAIYHSHKITCLLLKWEADPSIRNGMPLVLASRREKWNIVRTLLKEGARISDIPYEIGNSNLEKLFVQILKTGDQYNLEQNTWPHWLLHKYQSHIDHIQKGVE